ncbi:SpoIIE family protein phosphatase [Desulfovibrio sp. JC022]|uniref:SpoIIE family protein phosphatase n=1 Tax=Desulfovibrio sp. JC022 TaxID=2593642 RepID=UPI0013D2851E|nr:SpoIIE family protein phosphatase [Desulfovibrio sp. JC022]NDV24889.1 SpoIIE family protein phosphatase [Desulfovibrio sp. JC022]
MKIRWKMLIILLTFSLTPLFVLRTHGMNSLKELGADLQTQTRVTLLERATQTLAEQAKGAAIMIDIEERLYQTTLKSIQGEAELRLNDDDAVPKIKNAFITTQHKSFDTPDLINNPAYKKHALMGKGSNRRGDHTTMAAVQRGDLIDLPVTFEHISFWLAGNLSRKQAEADISRISPLLDDFNSCAETLKNLILWQEIILENGLVASYPGHNSFPRKYDPRKHTWYKEARKTGKANWTLPSPDAATKSLCNRLSAPLYNNDGQFIGVASLVIPIGESLNEALVSTDTQIAKVMMVTTLHRDDAHQNSLLVIGKIGKEQPEKQIHPAHGRFWQAPPEKEWLTEDNPEFKTLIRDVVDKYSGVLQMNYKGVPSLWTYSPVNTAISILIITPIHEFTAEADEAEQYVRESIVNQFEGTSLIAFAVILAIAVVAYFVSQSLSTPIRKLSEAMIKVGEGDWNARADFHSKDELGDLAQNFNYMVPQLREHSKIRQALSLADEAQQSLFPQSPPDIDGVEIGARCTFSEQTGGDYYDFVGCATCGPQTFSTAIGDVSGHGVSAALLMTSARAYMRALSGRGKSLVDSASEVNRLITKDCAQTGHFMTMFVAICNAQERTVNWIRAGHDPGLIYSPGTDTFDQLLGEGLALGVDETYQFREYLTQMEQGQILVLYTDGIWEAHSPAGKQFGKDKLQQLIRDNYHKSAQEMVDTILIEVAAHRNGLPLEDDCTIIVVKFI